MKDRNFIYGLIVFILISCGDKNNDNNKGRSNKSLSSEVSNGKTEIINKSLKNPDLQNVKPISLLNYPVNPSPQVPNKPATLDPAQPTTPAPNQSATQIAQPKNDDLLVFRNNILASEKQKLDTLNGIIKQTEKNKKAFYINIEGTTEGEHKGGINLYNKMISDWYKKLLEDINKLDLSKIPQDKKSKVENFIKEIKGIKNNIPANITIEKTDNPIMDLLNTYIGYINKVITPFLDIILRVVNDQDFETYGGNSYIPDTIKSLICLSQISYISLNDSKEVKANKLCNMLLMTAIICLHNCKSTNQGEVLMSVNPFSKIDKICKHEVMIKLSNIIKDMYEKKTIDWNEAYKIYNAIKDQIKYRYSY